MSKEAFRVVVLAQVVAAICTMGPLHACQLVLQTYRPFLQQLRVIKQSKLAK